MQDAPVFAIDFTAEGLTAAFVSADGGQEGLAGFDLCDFHAGGEKAFDKMLGLLLAKARTGDSISAVALSMACDLDASRTTIVNYPQATWLNGQPLPGILETALGVPVVMERRAVVSLHYDRAMLGLPESCLAIGCYIDTHYDSAIWHNGAPLLGRNGAAGNIAHMTIHGREDNCFCGKTGCVDLYGAGMRLQQLHTMIFPDTPIAELFVLHGEHPIIMDYLRMMAYPIAIEVNILDPDFLILGGSVPAYPEFPLRALETAIVDHRYRPASEHDTVFLPSAASMTPGVVCAAQYALAKISAKNR
jgi:allose kinase